MPWFTLMWSTPMPDMHPNLSLFSSLNTTLCFFVFMIQSKGIMDICWNKNSWKFIWCVVIFPLFCNTIREQISINILKGNKKGNWVSSFLSNIFKTSFFTSVQGATPTMCFSIIVFITAHYFLRTLSTMSPPLLLIFSSAFAASVLYLLLLFLFLILFLFLFLVRRLFLLILFLLLLVLLLLFFFSSTCFSVSYSDSVSFSPLLLFLLISSPFFFFYFYFYCFLFLFFFLFCLGSLSQ